MLDNFLDDSADPIYEEDDADFLFPEEETPKASKKVNKPSIGKDAKRGQKFLGMTAPQRLIIAIMLMFAICSLGAMCLLITGKFALY